MKPALRFAKNYGFLILVIVLILAGTIAYFAGFRIDQGGITRAGTLKITGLPAEAGIYIDEARRVRAVGGSVDISLTPGTHSVIVDTVGNQPWNEIFTITQSGETILTPILVPKELSPTLLVGANTDTKAKIAATKLPTKFAPLTLANGCALVYASGNRIIADATTTPTCTPPPYLTCADISSENPTGACASTIIFPGKEPVRAILPYPGRNDAVIFWSGGSVYVLELDPRQPQFFAPIFKGAVTGAAVYSDNSIVLTNGTQYVELPL